MDITQVKVFPVNEDKLKAFVSIVFDHCFMVNDIKIIQGKDGLFLSMPSRRKRSGEFKDVAHPLNNETRRLIEERVLAEYRAVADDATPRRPDREDEAEDKAEEKAGEEGTVRSPMPPPAEPSLPAVAPLAAGAAGIASPPAAIAASAPVDPSRTAASEPAEAGREKTLEEVQEHHLSDSFWSVS